VAIALSQISAFLLLARLTRIPYHQIALNTLCGITGLWAVASIFVNALKCDPAHPWLIQDTSCGPNLVSLQIALSFKCMLNADFPGNAVDRRRRSMRSCRTCYFGIPYCPGMGAADENERENHCCHSILAPIAVSHVDPTVDRQTTLTKHDSVLAILVIRLYFLAQALHGSDYIFELATPITLAEIQLFYSLIAATIPCLRPFLKAFNSGFMGVAATQADPTLYGSSDGRKGNSSYILQSRRGDNKSALRSAAHASRDEGRGFREVNIGQSHTCVEHDPMHNAETGSRTSDGSEKMIIRQTVAWDVQYDDSNANTSTKDVNMAESYVVEN
jgi:hypothetical protein